MVSSIIVHPIPGQEERNADHLLEAGAAIRCNNLPALAWRHAAREIAGTLLGTHSAG
jgi:UDP-N-acetylglucosamine:LPS N-acetylglucosamine transferase